MHDTVGYKVCQVKNELLPYASSTTVWFFVLYTPTQVQWKRPRVLLQNVTFHRIRGLPRRGRCEIHSNIQSLNFLQEGKWHSYISFLKYFHSSIDIIIYFVLDICWRWRTCIYQLLLLFLNCRHFKTIFTIKRLHILWLYFKYIILHNFIMVIYNNPRDLELD